MMIASVPAGRSPVFREPFPMSDVQANLHAAFARVIDAALDALEAAGTLPAGLPRGAVTASRRAIPRMAIWRPTPRWCWPSRPAPTRARWRPRWWRSWKRSRASRPKSPGRASSTCA
jgi:hypothetical protein